MADATLEYASTTTLARIREARPCTNGWTKLLKHLGKTASDDEPSQWSHDDAARKEKRHRMTADNEEISGVTEELNNLIDGWDDLKDALPSDGHEAASALFDYGDKLADALTAQSAEIARLTRELEEARARNAALIEQAASVKVLRLEEGGVLIPAPAPRRGDPWCGTQQRT